MCTITLGTSRDEQMVDGLIEEIETAMFTTRRSDGRLVSRPMATQKRAPIADLWFVTDIESHKMDELDFDANVNLGYFDNGSREWVSVSGTATISTGAVRSPPSPTSSCRNRTVWCSRCARSHATQRAAGEGHIVNISSVFGMMGIPSQSAYNAAKFGVRGFTEALRQEMLLNQHPVTVTCVHPGGIKTAIARNARVSNREDKDATARLFDKKLARMTPEKAAEIIIRGILRNQARVLVGIDAHALHHFAKLTGSRYQDIFARATKRMLPAMGISRQGKCPAVMCLRSLASAIVTERRTCEGQVRGLDIDVVKPRATHQHRAHPELVQCFQHRCVRGGSHTIAKSPRP